MYQSHWGLQELPFRSCLDPRFFYHSPSHEEALARLHFLVDQRRRVGLLLGVAGSGKSLLLEFFAEQLRQSGRPVAKVNLLGVEPPEMLCLMGAGLELNLDPAEPVARLWRALTDRLIEYRYQQLDTTILLDDADRAAAGTLELATRLAEHDPSPASRLTMVLAGQRTTMSRVGDRLLDLAELRIDLDPWEQSDTEAFLSSSLAQAGRQASVFADPAIARLHELSRGIPRRVSQLADLAMVAAAGEELQQVDAEVVESAFHELGLIEV